MASLTSNTDQSVKDLTQGSIFGSTDLRRKQKAFKGFKDLWEAKRQQFTSSRPHSRLTPPAPLEAVSGADQTQQSQQRGPTKQADQTQQQHHATAEALSRSGQDPQTLQAAQLQQGPRPENMTREAEWEEEEEEEKEQAPMQFRIASVESLVKWPPMAIGEQRARQTPDERRLRKAFQAFKKNMKARQKGYRTMATKGNAGMTTRVSFDLGYDLDDFMQELTSKKAANEWAPGSSRGRDDDGLLPELVAATDAGANVRRMQRAFRAMRQNVQKTSMIAVLSTRTS